MSVIEVKNLTRVYSYYKKEPGLRGSLKAFFSREILYSRAVNNISFTVEEGEIVGFLGPNGAGKTTTLKMLSGIIHPTSGTASVLGYVPWKRQSEYKKQFAIVMGQKNQLWEDLPALDSFILNKAIYEVSDRIFHKNLNRLVDILGVRHVLHVQVRKLSLGERMKCELIAALLHDPKVLFLDEPTIGLDVVAQKHMRDFIKFYNKEKKTTIILTSHYMEDIKELCRRVLIINRGSILYDGSLEALIGTYAPFKSIKVTFDNEVPKSSLRTFGEIDFLGPHHAVIRVPRKKAAATAASLLTSGLPVDDILIDEPDVNEVIRGIFREKTYSY
jgi:ABC-2 type transport system ATP-binding protein